MRGSKTYWVIMLVFLAFLFLASVRLYRLMEQAGYHWPFLNKTGSLTREIADLKVRNQNSVEDPAIARDLIPDITDTTAIADIRLAARMAGVEIDEIASEKPLRGGGGAIRQDEFSISMTGSFDQLALFINRLEGFGPEAVRRLFVINSLQIIANPDGKHHAEAVFMSYCYDPDTPRMMANRTISAIDLKSLVASREYIFTVGGIDPMLVPVFPAPAN